MSIVTSAGFAVTAQLIENQAVAALSSGAPHILLRAYKTAQPTTTCITSSKIKVETDAFGMLLNGPKKAKMKNKESVRVNGQFFIPSPQPLMASPY